MQVFLSTFVNKVDKKGRVSVPAQFRAALSAQPFQGIVAYRTYAATDGKPVVEASGIDRMAKFSEELATIDELSERAAYLSAVLADARQLAFDGEGRIVLPLDMAEHAGIAEEAAFVGLGQHFHLRAPADARSQVEGVLAQRRAALANRAVNGSAGS